MKRRQTLYIACEDMDFVWSEREVLRFDKLWNDGMGLMEIAKKLRRDPDEIVVLVLDRARQGFIKRRPSGIEAARRGAHGAHRSLFSNPEQRGLLWSRR